MPLSTQMQCERGDSNPHGLPHKILNLARLPVPSRSQATPHGLELLGKCSPRPREVLLLLPSNSDPPGRARTDTALLPTDLESVVSTNSTTGGWYINDRVGLTGDLGIRLPPLHSRGLYYASWLDSAILLRFVRVVSANLTQHRDSGRN